MDGCSLVISESGEGTPPVVMLHGLTGSAAEWDAVRSMLGPDVRQVAYSRPGVGGSGPVQAGLGPVPMSWVAGQLRDLLRAAGVSGPVVLAGHSMGGLIAVIYARFWPGEVAGLVLVDPSREPFAGDDRAWAKAVLTDADEGSILMDMQATAAEWRREAVRCPCVVVSSAVGRWLRLTDSADEFLPHTLADMDRFWQGWQQDHVEHLGAVHVRSKAAGHVVHCEHPELVALAVRSVLSAVTAGEGVGSTDTPARPEFGPGQVADAGGELVRS